MFDIITSLTPSRVQLTIGGAIGAAGMLISYLFGGMTQALEALLVAMAIDYMTGVLSAFINPGLKLDSRVGFRGIVKKIMILALVSLAHFLDASIGQAAICPLVTWFYFGNEGLSIIENAGKAGVPIPAKLRESLEQLKGGEHHKLS